MLQLQQQALLQIPGADTVRLQGLNMPQSGFDNLTPDSQSSCNPLHLFRKISVIIQAANQVGRKGLLTLGQRQQR
ncbi:hypothetical protein D3C76_1489560 [compost metagenome]